jgi:hypothetical protein
MLTNMLISFSFFFTLILPTLLFSLLFCGSIDNVCLCLSCAGSPVYMHHFVATLQRIFVNILKLLRTHTISRISDLLSSSLGKPCKLSSSRSGRSFLHDRTSITELTEDHASDTPYIASNTIFFS